MTSATNPGSTSFRIGSAGFVFGVGALAFALLWIALAGMVRLSEDAGSREMLVFGQLSLNTALVMLGIAAVATTIRNVVGSEGLAWGIAIVLAVGIFVTFMSRAVLSYS